MRYSSTEVTVRQVSQGEKGTDEQIEKRTERGGSNDSRARALGGDSSLIKSLAIELDPRTV